MHTTSEVAARPLAIDWEGEFSSSLGSVIDFVPKLVVFLIVLFVGWIIAKAVAEIPRRHPGAGRLHPAPRPGGAGPALSGAGVEPVALITKLAYYFIFLIALQLALTAFGPSNPVSEIVNDIVRWLPKALVAIVIVVIAAAVANAVKDVLAAALGGVSYGALLTKVVSGFIVALGVIAALNQVGIGLSVTLPVLIAVLGTVGGILVVGVGGGLIGPARVRWERWLGQMETESGARHAAPAGSATTAGQAPPPAPPGPAAPQSGL